MIPVNIKQDDAKHWSGLQAYLRLRINQDNLHRLVQHVLTKGIESFFSWRYYQQPENSFKSLINYALLRVDDSNRCQNLWISDGVHYCTCLVHKFNSSGGGPWVFRNNKANTIVDDALTPCVASLSVELTLWGKRTLVYNGERFQCLSVTRSVPPGLKFDDSLTMYINMLNINSTNHIRTCAEYTL